MKSSKLIAVAVCVLLGVSVGAEARQGTKGPKTSAEKKCQQTFNRAVEDVEQILTWRQWMLNRARNAETNPGAKEICERTQRCDAPDQLSFAGLINKTLVTSAAVYPKNFKGKMAPGGGPEFIEGRGDKKTCAIGMNIVETNPDKELVAVFMPSFGELKPRSAVVPWPLRPVNWQNRPVVPWLYPVVIPWCLLLQLQRKKSKTWVFCP